MTQCRYLHITRAPPTPRTASPIDYSCNGGRESAMLKGQRTMPADKSRYYTCGKDT